MLTLILVLGAYSEGYPNQQADVVLFHDHPVPHSTAALTLVAVACLALAWRRRYPVTVLAVSITAVTIYSLLGYVNGAALLAPDPGSVRGRHPGERLPGDGTAAVVTVWQC